MRRLDIGIASFRNPEKLLETIHSIERQSVTDWRCFIVMSNDPTEPNVQANTIARGAAERNPRFVAFMRNHDRESYSGAVNTLFALAQTEYIAYLDNDVEINSHAWDETLCTYLDRFHEIGMIHPNGGSYQLDRGAYTEIMWAAGFAWIVNRLCMAEVGKFDEAIGHQNECDWALRVRMAGWKCAAAPEVSVSHHATATNDPAAIERINRGVREFVDKWNRIFNGKNFNYHSVNVTRWDDWPPNALYLEEFWQARLPGLNANPEVRNIDGRDYDLIRVPRYSGFYRNRVI